MLDAALAFFTGHDRRGVSLSGRNVGGITTARNRNGTETGSLLSPEDIETLEAFPEDDGAITGKWCVGLSSFRMRAPRTAAFQRSRPAGI